MPDLVLPGFGGMDWKGGGKIYERQNNGGKGDRDKRQERRDGVGRRRVHSMGGSFIPFQLSLLCAAAIRLLGPRAHLLMGGIIIDGWIT